MQSVPGCEALGQIRYDGGKYQEAEAFLRVALQHEPHNAQILMLLAQAIMGHLQEMLRDDPPLAWRIPEETRARLSEVEGLLTHAVVVLEGFDNHRPLRT